MWSFSSRDLRVLDRNVYTPECAEREREKLKEDKVQDVWGVTLSQCPSAVPTLPAQPLRSSGSIWSRQLCKTPHEYTCLKARV